MFENWSKSRSRRVAIRGTKPDTGTSWREWRERGGMASIGIAVVFCVILAALFMLREDVVQYRTNQYVPHDITARVDFNFPDKSLLDDYQKLARDSAPRIYQSVPFDLWGHLQTQLLALPNQTHNAKLDQLEPPLRSILDNGALTQLEEDRTGRNRTRYEEKVKEYVTYARQQLSPEGHPLVILNEEQFKDEGHRIGKIKLAWAPHLADVGSQTKSIVTDQIVDVATDTYSTELTDALRAKLHDYATKANFELALSSKIADITAAELKAHPTFVLDERATLAEQNALAANVSQTEAVQKYSRNDVIVSAGTISDRDFYILREENSAYHRSLRSNMPSQWLGMMQYRAGLAMIAAIITLLLCAYVVRYQPRCVRNHTRGITICVLLLSMLMLSQLAAIGNNKLLIFGIAPTILAAMILTIAYDQRFAMGVSTLLAIVVTVALDQHIGFFLILWTGALTTCYFLDEIRTRSKLIEVGGAAALAMMVVTAAIGAVDMAPFRFILTNSLYTGAAGLAAGFVVLGILPFIEKTFRITTAMTLLELADASQPLLRRLALEAPGTYNHSLQVATLAEAAAEAIKGNSLACRVGAYYHDIGKINKADYFVENQLGGPSRHLNLTPDLSLRIIIGHVKDGVEMAKEYNLPSSLLPFIHQHHGTTLVEYFYHAAQGKTAEDQPNISEYHFRYPGPKPRSKETAIVMICDAVESALRAMPEPTASRIEKLVHELSLKRLLDGQFDECDLTMRDLDAIERALAKTLLGIYHGRIAYPSSSDTARPLPGITAKTA